MTVKIADNIKATQQTEGPKVNPNLIDYAQDNESKTESIFSDDWLKAPKDPIIDLTGVDDSLVVPKGNTQCGYVKNEMLSSTWSSQGFEPAALSTSESASFSDGQSSLCEESTALKAADTTGLAKHAQAPGNLPP
ncbi:hypothetical protein N7493_000152 [Penicillium malachiteum]|uniref:Uncharacterized protein n=1 Tax=Penicillium malachiteum TaxID=1324776 RepID=A0AAD6HVT3_9EURO|nr:hypothetical protein N7493_000152 [Penicillium malachiteum]